jgi:hypothetical protein
MDLYEVRRTPAHRGQPFPHVAHAAVLREPAPVIHNAESRQTGIDRAADNHYPTSETHGIGTRPCEHRGGTVR